ncbi:short-chain dehydrogenase/reductase family protein [Favolaschia claudopus]|uniref:Short-chain dehydrogenase/reductase family protein n=1 Tax=Favolaschia claudopus TaxID=2862362 RepID=A0AAV9ZHH6_9AGAR
MSPPQFFFTTTAEEVANTFANEIEGKNVLITGTSLNGIGFEAARAIAKHANLVVITGYNEARLKLSEEALTNEIHTVKIRRLVLDLSSLAAVRKAAAEVNTYPEPIHVLIHNAAATIGPFKLTVDGLESQIATAHIGSTLPLHQANPPQAARVHPATLRASSSPLAKATASAPAKPSKEAYETMDAYYQAKSAMVLMAIELSKRSNGRINGYSLEPGLIHTNMNQKAESVAGLQAIGVLDANGNPSSDRFQWKTIPQGAATIVAAAFDPSLNAIPGAYLADSTAANDKIAAHSSDNANAKKLWDVTEEIVGEMFVFDE